MDRLGDLIVSPFGCAQPLDVFVADCTRLAIDLIYECKQRLLGI